MDVFFTVDVEPDCLPYLSSYRGMETGLERLLELVAIHEIRATFFCTGHMAHVFPEKMESIVSQGHELGCHGYTHENFSAMTVAQARRDLILAEKALRPFYPVSSFRAPYLDFPRRFLPILEERGYGVDSSLARYKPLSMGYGQQNALVRAPVSVTSSVLRLPFSVTRRWLRMCKPPLVLFVHPWEFVDWTKTRLRADCRFNTGMEAIVKLDRLFHSLKAEGAVFHCLEDARAQELFTR